MRKFLLLQIQHCLHRKQKFPPTLGWEKTTQIFQVNRDQKGERKQVEGGKRAGRKEEGQMAYRHKTVQNLIKTGNRTEVRRGRRLSMHLVSVLARAQPLGGVPLGPLPGHPVVLGSVAHVLSGDAAHQGVGRVAVCEERADGQEDFRDGQGRTPVILEDV